MDSVIHPLSVFLDDTACAGHVFDSHSHAVVSLS
jgi:hypothetical protein